MIQFSHVRLLVLLFCIFGRFINARDIVVDSIALTHYLPNGVQLRLDSVGLSLDSSRRSFIHDSSRVYSIYRYSLAFISHSRDGSYSFGVSGPKITSHTLRWPWSLSYSATGDTTRIDDFYSGVVSPGTSSDLTIGSVVYVPVSSVVASTSATTTSTSYQAYTTGIHLIVSLFLVVDSLYVSLNLNQSAPTSSGSPPNTSSSVLVSKIFIPHSGIDLSFVGFRRYTWRRNWWLLGLARTLEISDEDIRFRLEPDTSLFLREQEKIFSDPAR